MALNLRTLALILAVGSATTRAQQAAPPISRETYATWMHELSNAGRWGRDDRLGTLNLITPAVRLAAVQLVHEGSVVSMGRDVVPGPDSNTIRPTRLGLFFPPPNAAGVSAALDSLFVIAHGYADTHVDALSHFGFGGKLYNDVPTSAMTGTSAGRLGVEVMRDGIVSRGVLVDVPRFKHVSYLTGSTVITVGDLEAWERENGVHISAGDAVLIRTGRDVRARELGRWRIGQVSPGLHPTVAAWLHARDVAVIGSDVGTDVAPSLVEGTNNPVHGLALAAMGMPLLDNMNLEDVAQAAASRGRATFLFVASPIRIRGSTSSLVNPLAIF